MLVEAFGSSDLALDPRWRKPELDPRKDDVGGDPLRYGGWPHSSDQDSWVPMVFKESSGDERVGENESLHWATGAEAISLGQSESALWFAGIFGMMRSMLWVVSGMLAGGNCPCLHQYDRKQAFDCIN